MCEISGEIKIGANESGETFIGYQNRWLTLEEFKHCNILPDTKFVLKIAEEKVKIKNVANNSNIRSLTSFNDHNDYSLLSPLVINDFGITETITYAETQQPQSTPIDPPDNITSNVTDFVIGGAAFLAMIMSILQQIRQKKKEAEATMCCNNNKIEIQKFETELKKLEQKIDASQEKNNKALHAEIFEQYKEIKEIKENFDELQTVLEKVIDRSK